MAHTIATIEVHLELDEGTILNPRKAGLSAAEKVQQALDDAYKAKGQVRTKFIAVRFSEKFGDK